MRSRAVALSPTGQSWAAATTEGLLLYTLDQGATFDPTDLTEDITPQVIPLASHIAAFYLLDKALGAIYVYLSCCFIPALGTQHSHGRQRTVD